MELDSENVYLLLGSNLGDRDELINAGLREVAFRIGDVFSTSSFYETAAWGKEDQPSFLNVAVGVTTIMSPLEVLETALQIESELGRVRYEKWGERLIDIDVIFYGDRVVDMGDRLQIPHPQMQYRKFVLEPLAEIASKFVHPVLQLKISEILERLNDNLSVTKI
ncbi:2-amino-4-hydroxy-6-hydroxymethyldihydropteridine diphosphokinase [Pedobacter nyackensis]|uniref:2-amino-4-hydroxy-6- hydroxymethyldihydropteridine diphosphokinase n=1 Tax=Pedobacter nyackensis TaxID=475255 RepID=UPI00292F12DF|nr:2-amino-4-hydroxy-6-hydroxymethyldihydropteridine diphosphokinase [Pedobacter nyackensis]